MEEKKTGVRKGKIWAVILALIACFVITFLASPVTTYAYEKTKSDEQENSDDWAKHHAYPGWVGLSSGAQFCDGTGWKTNQGYFDAYIYDDSVSISSPVCKYRINFEAQQVIDPNIFGSGTAGYPIGAGTEVQFTISAYEGTDNGYLTKRDDGCTFSDPYGYLPYIAYLKNNYPDASNPGAWEYCINCRQHGVYFPIEIHTPTGYAGFSTNVLSWVPYDNAEQVQSYFHVSEEGGTEWFIESSYMSANIRQLGIDTIYSNVAGHSVIAIHFYKNTATIQTNVEHGKIYLNGEEKTSGTTTSVSDGSSNTVSYTADAGYYISSIQVSTDGGASWEEKLNGATRESVVFSPTTGTNLISVKFSHYGVKPTVTNGSIKVDGAEKASGTTAWKALGDSTSVTFSANAGYGLKDAGNVGSAIGISGGTRGSTSFTATFQTSTADTLYEPYAEFASQKITATAENGTVNVTVDSGSTTKSGNVTNVPYYSNATVSYAPSDGYYLSSVTVDGSAVDINTYPNSYTFSNISADHTVNVVYGRYVIKPTVTNGTVQIDGTAVTSGQTYYYALGSSHTVTFTANSGYTLKSTAGGVTGTEGATTASGTFSSTANGAEFTPSAVFARHAINIKHYHAVVALNGTEKNADSSTYVPHLSDNVITYKPYDPSRYMLKSVTDNGVAVNLVTNPQEYRIDDIDKDHDVVVTCFNPFANTKPEKKVFNADGTDIDGCIVSAGEVLTYQITAVNPTAVARDVTLTDALPSYVSIVEGSISDGGTLSNGVITWDLTNLAADGSKTVTFQVTVDADAEDVLIKNSATQTLKKLSGSLEEDITCKTNIVTNAVMADSADHLNKKVTDENGDDKNQTVVKAGDMLTYTIHLKNPADTQKEFLITDHVPESMEIVAISDESLAAAGYRTSHDVAWTVAIPAQESKDLTIHVKVTDDSQGLTLKNKANILVRDANKVSRDTNEVVNYTILDPTKMVYDAEHLTDGNIDGQTINDKMKLQYTIRYKNPVDGDRTLVITDKLPSGVKPVRTGEFEVAFTGVQDYLLSDEGTYDADTNTVTWTIAAGAYEEGAVMMVVYVDESTQNTIVSNKATLTVVTPSDAGLHERNVSAQSNIVKNPIFETPVKKVSREDGEDVSDKFVKEGEVLYYSITFKNPAENARQFTVVDTIPEMVHLADKSEVGSEHPLDPGSLSANGIDNYYISDAAFADYDKANRTITWNMTLAGKTEKTVYFYVVVDEVAKGEAVYNKAEITTDRANKYTIFSDDIPDGTPVYVLDDPDKAVLNAEGADIDGVVKQAGDLITYWITFGNPSKKEMTATVTDILPEGVEFVSGNDIGQDSYNAETGDYVDTIGELTCSYSAADHIVTWSAPVAGECQRTVSCTVRILDSASGTVLRNVANVYFQNVDKDTNPVDTPVLKDPVKMVFQGASLSGNDIADLPVTIGDTITYAITYVNPAEEEKVSSVMDKLPEGVAYVSSSNQGTYDADSHTVTWHNVKTDAGKRQYVTVTVKVLETAQDSVLENYAMVYMDEASLRTKRKNPNSPTDDPEPSDDENIRNFVNTKHVYNEDNEEINDRFVAAGDILTYTISYQNTTDLEQHYKVVDQMDENLTILSVTKGGKIENNTVTWDFGAEPNKKDVLTVVVQVKETAQKATIKNKALIETTNPVTNVTQKETTNEVVNYVYDKLEKKVTDEKGKDVEKHIVQAGDTLVYSVTCANPAPQTRTFTITDKLPEGVTFVSCDNEGSFENGTVTWVMDIESGKEVTVKVTAKVAEDVKGVTARNVAEIAADNSSVSSNSVDNYILKEPEKEVYIGEIDLNGGSVKAGQLITFRIKYQNPTDEALTITIKDKLDSTIAKSVTEVSDGGSIAGDTITWTLKDTAPHVDGAVTFVVKVPELEDAKEITNTASVIFKDAKGKTQIDTNTVKVTIEKKPTAQKKVPVTGDPVVFPKLTNILEQIAHPTEEKEQTKTVKGPTKYIPIQYEVKQKQLPEEDLQDYVFVQKSVPNTGDDVISFMLQHSFHLPRIHDSIVSRISNKK